jgi:hypothetical protein
MRWVCSWRRRVRAPHAPSLEVPDLQVGLAWLVDPANVVAVGVRDDDLANRLSNADASNSDRHLTLSTARIPEIHRWLAERLRAAGRRRDA